VFAFFSPTHIMHAPEYEFHRGERVPCFETPRRAEIVHAELLARGHDIQESTEDSTGILQRVHTRPYLNFLETAWQQWVDMDPANGGVQPFPAVWPVRTLRDDIEPGNFTAKLGLYSIDNETPLVKGTWVAAKGAADAVVSAVAFVQRTGERAVFCATRPPGHHAGPDFMGGYCFLNNAAIAVEALQSRDYNHVAVLDVDYHHGNGTQAIFYHRSDVLTVSIHGDPRTEYPFFLGHEDEIGEEDGEGFNVNLPLPAGTSASEWFHALDIACKRIQSHRPDALVLSLGLDTFEADPISKFRLRSEDFLHVGSVIADLELPTVIVLEGGYATNELGVNACNVLEGFERA